MCLTDIDVIKLLLKKYGFAFSKSLGQNFIVDSTVCPAIADSLPLKGCGVIEVGTGIGVLTKELAKRADKVVAVELDRSLFPILNETLGEYNNIKIIHGDILKTDLSKLIAEEFGDKKVYLCGNLPYYITTPIIMSILEGKVPVEAMSVMVQKEAAVRLCAPVGTREGGAVSVAVNYYTEPDYLFDVKREAFIPSPNVDSAVIRLDIRKNPPVFPSDEKFFFKTVKAAFAQRRKTLVNSVSATLKTDKETVLSALSQLGIEPTVRAEKMTIDDFCALSDILLKTFC